MIFSIGQIYKKHFIPIAEHDLSPSDIFVYPPGILGIPKYIIPKNYCDLNIGVIFTMAIDFNF
jgi:hypothetical protein